MPGLHSPGVAVMPAALNQAIEQLVVAMQGDDGWRGAWMHAQHAADGLAALQAYDDDLTWRLVSTVCARTGLPAHAVLQGFGRYWLRFTGSGVDQDGPPLTACSGDPLRDLLADLQVHAMHGHVETVFPSLRLPVLRVQDLGPGCFRLIHSSDRLGLAPMILGLVEGLALHFGQSVSVQQLQACSGLDDADEFIVSQHGG